MGRSYVQRYSHSEYVAAGSFWPAIGVTLLGLLVRFLVGLSSYSGAHDPPKYGDYEAQRHWMEVTVNLPISEWYTSGPSNNESYWPIDYPPLSAYQSWVYGAVLQKIDPALVALHDSQGYESPGSKRLMRMTVIMSDILVLLPATIAFIATLQPLLRGHETTVKWHHQISVLTAILLQPALLLVDHAHFQYNGISLGLTVGAVAAILMDHDCWGSVLYSLALNHKQMSLYFAPAFFGYLLGKCWAKPGGLQKVLGVVKLGLAVVVTFLICWAPFINSSSGALQVLHRIFPVRRGLYEDYVANFWCVSSVIIKWKTLLPGEMQLRLCLLATLVALMGPMVHQILRPSPKGFVLALTNSAFAFYMFSFHVHEKSILLPLLPISLLSAVYPHLATWVPLVGAFSMFPLLERDQATIAYLGTALIYWSTRSLDVLGCHQGVSHNMPAGDRETPEQSALGAKTVTTESARRGDGEGPKATRRAGPTSRQEGAILQNKKMEKENVDIALQAGNSLGWHVTSLLVGYRDLWAILGLGGCLALHVARAALPTPQGLPWLYDRLFVTFSFILLGGVYLFTFLEQFREPEGGKKGKT